PPGMFLDIHTLVKCCGERGLLGLAFHPDYASNHYLYVYYTANESAADGLFEGDIVIARYQAPSATANTVNPDTARIILKIAHHSFANHNGGAIVFGPDGYLYLGVGDGGGGGDPLGSGQNRETLLGKILRLDVDTAGNPPPA